MTNKEFVAKLKAIGGTGFYFFWNGVRNMEAIHFFGGFGLICAPIVIGLGAASVNAQFKTAHLVQENSKKIAEMGTKIGESFIKLDNSIDTNYKLLSKTLDTSDKHQKELLDSISKVQRNVYNWMLSSEIQKGKDLGSILDKVDKLQSTLYNWQLSSDIQNNRHVGQILSSLEEQDQRLSLVGTMVAAQIQWLNQKVIPWVNDLGDEVSVNSELLLGLADDIVKIEKTLKKLKKKKVKVSS